MTGLEIDNVLFMYINNTPIFVSAVVTFEKVSYRLSEYP